MKKTKSLTILLLLSLLLSALALPAAAAEGEAIGNFPQSSYSQSESETAAESGTESEKLISLSDGVSYSSEKKLFYYPVGSSRFGMSVPDGAIITEPVSIVTDAGLTATLYRNGTAQEKSSFSNIGMTGKYVLMVSTNDSTQSKRVTFTILSPVSGDVKEYILPTDFFMVSATRNGEETSYSQTYVDMSSDGEYALYYRSPAADKDMYLNVTLDHTPPTVTLSGLTDGKANGPVTVSDVEEGASLYLVRNGSDIAYTDTITETGSYTLTVQDKAGNETVYNFLVVAYVNSSLKTLLISLGTLLVGLIGYIIYYRKYIRVS